MNWKRIAEFVAGLEFVALRVAVFVLLLIESTDLATDRVHEVR